LIEFDTNTIAYMTAALEQSCRQLKEDTPAARAFIADRLEDCARAGGKSMVAFNEAASRALRELNQPNKDKDSRGFWQRLLKWNF
jgi:ketopantoate reductase